MPKLPTISPFLYLYLSSNTQGYSAGAGFDSPEGTMKYLMKEWRNLTFYRTSFSRKTKETLLFSSPFPEHKIIISCPIAGLLLRLFAAASASSLFFFFLLRIMVKLFITTDRQTTHHPKTKRLPDYQFLVNTALPFLCCCSSSHREDVKVYPTRRSNLQAGFR